MADQACPHTVVANCPKSRAQVCTGHWQDQQQQGVLAWVTFSLHKLLIVHDLENIQQWHTLCPFLGGRGYLQVNSLESALGVAAPQQDPRNICLAGWVLRAVQQWIRQAVLRGQTREGGGKCLGW